MSDTSDGVDLASTTLTHRVVLLGVAGLAGRGETPAHTAEVIRACAEGLETVEDGVVGTVSEAEVSRALNELEAAGLVEKVDLGETSPVGKGRPAYALVPGTDDVLDRLADDDRVVGFVDHVREGRA